MFKRLLTVSALLVSFLISVPSIAQDMELFESSCYESKVNVTSTLVVDEQSDQESGFMYVFHNFTSHERLHNVTAEDTETYESFNLTSAELYEIAYVASNNYEEIGWRF